MTQKATESAMTLSLARLEDVLTQFWSELAPNAAVAGEVATWLTTDSREVSPGATFVAIPGVAADGRDYIDKALDAGAALALGEAKGCDMELLGGVLPDIEAALLARNAEDDISEDFGSTHEGDEE